jgi:hypothetical protein
MLVAAIVACAVQRDAALGFVRDIVVARGGTRVK